MSTITLERTGERMLSFDGRQIAHAGSDDGHRDRWSELTIYRCSTGGWIVHKVGRTRVQGETDRSTVKVCRHAVDVVAALRQRGVRGDTGQEGSYLTDLALRLLETAASLDPGLRSALVESIPA